MWAEPVEGHIAVRQGQGRIVDDHALGVSQNPRHRTLTALLGVLQGGNPLPISDLGIGTSVEEGAHNLLVAP